MIKKEHDEEQMTPTGDETKDELGFEHTNDEISDAEMNGGDSVEALKKEVQKLKESLLRNAADYENFKKRKESEVWKIREYASEKIIKELFPIYEDLSRSIESVNKGETNDVETLKKGLQAIFEKFKNVLTAEGVEEIDSLGKEFDVNLSDAIAQIPRDDVPPNTVVEVIEKGFKMKDKIVKHDKVLVSKKPD
ncbi:MAG: nucleotide exchange factor GrpE [Ignavibacteriae bacterium]|nr:nucleotide exchange factor GrpE [Ignavibacteriota bacterium]MCB9242380.1 nucleotide exchange factor GrpE [Ignavibacteriales bacterium]